MSEAEIHYLIPEQDRPLDDTEKIINAMGDFLSELPFPVDREYDPEPIEVAGNAVLIKLKHTTREQKYDHELLEEAERMRRGVEKHFSDEERARLSSHFFGIARAGAIEVEEA